MSTLAISRDFIWRRLHSLMGLWLVVFLIEHLLTNSQAAIWLGDNGQGFVRMVNALHNLPYLQAIEVTLLGIPILIHMVMGLKYLFTAKFVSNRTDGSAPNIKRGRNRAYKWQRITSWILLFGLIGHVAKFRFIDYPEQVRLGRATSYLMPVNVDDRLYALSEKLDVTLYSSEMIEQAKVALDNRRAEGVLVEAAADMQKSSFDPVLGLEPERYDAQKAVIYTSAENYQNAVKWVGALEKEKIDQNQVVAVCKDFGTATLLAVRNTFKSPVYAILYTIFVMAACFHAFNGFWTFLITWGWVLKMSAQRAWACASVALVLLFLFLGLAAIWGSYWINI